MFLTEVTRWVSLISSTHPTLLCCKMPFSCFEADIGERKRNRSSDELLKSYDSPTKPENAPKDYISKRQQQQPSINKQRRHDAFIMFGMC
jgi:hypothetical protein